MSRRTHYPILGEKFGEFTVISEEINKTEDEKVQYRVKCSCGTEQWIRAYFLKVGRQTRCHSCSQKKALLDNPSRQNFIDKGHEGIGNLTKTFYNHFKINARRRDIEWNDRLTLEYLWNLFIEQDKKCALSGVDIDFSEIRKSSNPDFLLITASLDRIRNEEGYVIGNIQWVHKDVNKMKNTFDQDYFIDLCGKIFNNKNEIYEQQLVSND